VAGESSCGKTTLIKVISGNAKPPLKVNSGSVNYHFWSHDVDMLHISQEELRDNVRWKEISYVMQGSMSVLNPVRKIGWQVSEAITTHSPGLGHRAVRIRVEELLELVGIPAGRADDYPHQLSGGQKQRVMIALALACGPQLLIADEPTTALDVTVQAQIMDLLRQMNEETGTAIILITHNIALVSRFCSRVLVMYAGRFVEAGPTLEVFDSPKHPYTAALLKAVPRVEARLVDGLTAIEGRPPDLARKPAGCAFHPRCAQRRNICSVDQPPSIAAGPGREARCWLVAEEPGSVNPDLLAATEIQEGR
jgi:oligopeptide/dipeptide ABC transporter ATP-binding protein